MATKYYFSNQEPSTFDEKGFEELEFTEIGSVTNKGDLDQEESTKKENNHE